MYIYQSVGLNNVQLTEMPFGRELYMESYIIENPSVLALDDGYFSDPIILDQQVTIPNGRSTTNRDGRIDLFVQYEGPTYAIVELKACELLDSHVQQLCDYMDQSSYLINDHIGKLNSLNDDYISDNDGKSKSDSAGFLGILVGTKISPELFCRLAKDNFIVKRDDREFKIIIMLMKRYQTKECPQRFVIVDVLNEPSNIKNRNDYTKYSIDGQCFSKNQFVLDYINKFVDWKRAQNLKVTYSSLKKEFPDKLQGTYGVFKDVEEASGKTRNGIYRYYLKPTQIITLDDGVDIAVCNQWGLPNFTKFYAHCRKIKNFPHVLGVCK